MDYVKKDVLTRVLIRQIDDLRLIKINGGFHLNQARCHSCY